MTTRNTEPAQITRNMTNKSTESPKAEAGAPAAQAAPGKAPGPPEHLGSQSDNRIYKSGPLFLSSKGIGWTQWKKRWFILTRTSLVFFRSDPNAIPLKANEVNLTLGGIDLNNSGSVEVKADKKLLTVVFPDGREGRTFTLKAETSEDLNDWKIALENALAQAPPPANATGENADSGDNLTDSIDGSSDQSKDTQPVKSSVIGRPILLALEDVDGTPSFLEKALRFIEDYGSKVEGILRQAADVELVERRVLDYEQGKTEFSEGEDAHVVADCVKHVLREMPSSPVPASCCKALLEAVRAERGKRVNAIRIAVCDTFPEPNRRLLQRILMMMQKVASNKNQNRMSSSAVAACMAPLLLRPLLAGECEIEHDFDVGGDGSAQLLQAAAAANHAQAIVITLLDEYDSIFGEGSLAGDLYDNSEESGTESGEATDDESYDDDDYDGSSQGTDGDDDGASQETDADDDLASGETYSDVDDEGSNDPNDKEHDAERATTSVPQQEEVKNHGNSTSQCKSEVINHGNEPTELEGDSSSNSELEHHIPPACIQKSITIANGPPHDSRRRQGWGRTSAKKNLSMESINYPFDDEAEIQRLEAAKNELQNKIEEEAKENTVLQSDLEKRREALQERRLALEQDVARLEEQLEKERNLRAALEAGLGLCQGALPDLSTVDKKTKEELEDLALAEADVSCLKQKVSDLGVQLNEQRQQNSIAKQESNKKPQETSNNQNKEKDKQKYPHDTVHSDLSSSRTKGCKSQMTTEVEGSKADQESSGKHASPEKTPASESHLSKGSGGSQSPHIHDKNLKDTEKPRKTGSQEYR